VSSFGKRIQWLLSSTGKHGGVDASTFRTSLLDAWSPLRVVDEPRFEKELEHARQMVNSRFVLGDSFHQIAEMPYFARFLAVERQQQLSSAKRR
jgi:hypothetical protein